ncbi:MAG: hypothetical protein R3284_11715 [Rubricoccaceae bacterium]|nr:hypothetical protein [Rubricoccaceae bacterium]
MKTAFSGYGARLPFNGWIVRHAALLLWGALTAGIASGAETNWTVHPYLQDKWNFQLGVFYPTVDTSARLDSSTLQRGTEIDFEGDLALDDRKALGSIFGSVRLGEKWRIELEYFGLNRSGTRQINRTINWGDNTYPINAAVNSSFDSDVYRLSGGYSFVKDDKKEFGAALGLFTTYFEASLSSAAGGFRKADTLAPLPTIGAYGAYAFDPRWLAYGRADYFWINYDDYDGSLINTQIAAEYRFTRRFGVGLGYRYVKYNLQSTDTKWHGDITYKFHGPNLYFTASF